MPREKEMLERLRQACVAGLVVLLMTACGGGGGGGGGVPGDGGAATVRFDMPVGVVTQVAGHPLNVELHGTFSYAGTQTLYLAAEESAGLVTHGNLVVYGDGVYLTLTLAPQPVGVHETQLRLWACFDSACAQPAGPPASMTLRYEVTPNVDVASTLSMDRTGHEAAPSARLPVTVPAEAGALTMRVETAVRENFAVTFDGRELSVATRQERAGTYRAHVVLESASDPRYSASVDIDYTVHPPAGGEQPMLLSDRQFDLYLPQGDTATRRISVTRATWTDALAGPDVYPAQGPCAVQARGDDIYDVVVDTRGQEQGSHVCLVRFDASPTGPTEAVSFNVNIGAAFSLPQQMHVALSPSSTTADLRATSPVLSADSTPQHWSARSLNAWLRVLTPSGTTGTDALVVEVDATALPTLPGLQAAQVEVTSDRPGTLPLLVNVGLGNGIPRLDVASAHAIVGHRARLYFDGFIPMSYGTSLMDSGALKVDGARLVDAVTLTDPRFAGTLAVLRVDLDSAVPGTDVTVRVESALSPSQIRLPVEATTPVPAGYAALPVGRYRPVSYAPGLDAAYFAGAGRVYRWHHAGGAWQLVSASLSDVIDAAPRPDEQAVYATVGRDVVGFDPVTMAALTRSTLPSGPYTDGEFDLTPPAGQRAFTFAADLRAFAGKRGTGLQSDITGATWLWGPDSVELGTAIGWGGPGTALYGPASGSALVRSPSGSAIVSVYGPTAAELYLAEARAPQTMTGPFAATPIVAVSDDGRRVVFADGTLRADGVIVAGLSGLLPAGQVAGGYALDATGSFAFVYGYRIAVESGIERARDAALWVIDLRGPAPPGIDTSVPLGDAVGCITPPAAQESCRHDGAITITADGSSAFVIGPRAIAATPLPAQVAAPLASGRRASMAAPPRAPWRAGIIRQGSAIAR